MRPDPDPDPDPDPELVRVPAAGDRVSRRRALGLLGGAAAAVTGLVGGLRYLGSPAPRPRVAAGTTRVVERYGDGPRQDGEWWLPPAGPAAGTAGGADRAAALLPTVVLVHGGYWRRQYGRSLEDAVAADLAARGNLVWNVDYAASDRPWPSTLRDAALAYDHLAVGRFADRVDPARIAVVGHSAGGHLALWLASRQRVPAGGPGAVAADRPGWGTPAAAGTAPRPALVVAQAPVAALAQASRQGLGAGAVDAFVGGVPGDVPERYAVADPVALLPTGVPSVLVHGEDDDVVPMGQSEAYTAVATRKGDRTRLVRVPGGHFEHLDPTTPAVAALREALAGLA